MFGAVQFLNISISTLMFVCSIYLIDLFHIVSAHACVGHASRDFLIIGETLHRWGKQILSQWHFLCDH